MVANQHGQASAPSNGRIQRLNDSQTHDDDAKRHVNDADQADWTRSFVGHRCHFITQNLTSCSTTPSGRGVQGKKRSVYGVQSATSTHIQMSTSSPRWSGCFNTARARLGESSAACFPMSSSDCIFSQSRDGKLCKSLAKVSNGKPWQKLGSLHMPRSLVDNGQDEPIAASGLASRCVLWRERGCRQMLLRRYELTFFKCWMTDHLDMAFCGLIFRGRA
jgi:hypothetical protein